MKVKLFNIEIDALSMRQTLDIVEDAVANDKHIHHTVVNAGKIVLMQEDKELEKSVNEADLINADGQAVVWASKMLGSPLPERVSGIDLMEKLVKRSFEKGYRCYFLGAEEDVVSNLITLYKKKYSNNVIAGYRNGYFKKSDEKRIAKVISQSNANILFVAITSPKKEIFLNTYKKELKNINFIMGVGGSFDVIAGKVNRAPKWMQDIGFEWLYRVIQEPRRMFMRYLVGNTKFIYLVLKEFFLLNRKI
ncbi:WecB/TagA/CpsF family glycosyltransferase [Flavobacteriales bacterium]|jgi:N-acetylglucosaminyldiphosphoundecaprenol N-acetyl-beta-D-mannosaminyltransferase|nr:WecB/TagA/CpsF family glycosyltransferase [Flavobacteriales bacterium]MDC3390453.1 WecB/TagA/CpsF family glycosyltransferase [Flavobacteriales bacterium]